MGKGAKADVRQRRVGRGRARERDAGRGDGEGDGAGQGHLIAERIFGNGGAARGLAGLARDDDRGAGDGLIDRVADSARGPDEGVAVGDGDGLRHGDAGGMANEGEACAERHALRVAGARMRGGAVRHSRTGDGVTFGSRGAVASDERRRSHRCCPGDYPGPQLPVRTRAGSALPAAMIGTLRMPVAVPGPRR